MVVTELTLLIARFGVLALMFIFVLVLVLALRADARAAVEPPRVKAKPRPEPKPAPAAPAAQLRTLTVTNGTPPTTGREYQLFGPLQIGRNLSNNIAIPNNFVSTQHARLFSTDGRWMVEDLGSTNGTFLNGKAVSSAQPLKPGDKILIGDTEFQVQ